MNKAIVLSLLVVLVASFVFATPVLSTHNTGHCGPSAYLEKDDNGAPFVSSGSNVISSVWIKAGQGCFEFTSDSTNGCYTVLGLGTVNVLVTGGGTGPNCQNISHVEFYGGSVTPTVTDSPTPTPTQEPSATPTDEPSVTPTETPTPTLTDEPSATPTETPTPTPTEEPSPTVVSEENLSPTETPTSSPTESQSNSTPTPTSAPAVAGTSTSFDDPGGQDPQVLGLATTSSQDNGLFYGISGLFLAILGAQLAGVGIYENPKKR